MLARLKFVPFRMLQAVPVAFGVTLAVFLLSHLIPGNPALSLLGAQATPDRVKALTSQLGLDKPLPEQYWKFLDNIVHGRLGDSLTYHVSVASLVTQRAPVTILLVLYSVVMMLAISVPVAALAASKPDAVRDHVVRVVPMVGLGMPQFWTGIMLLLLFAVTLKIFPVGGYGDGMLDHLYYLFLPALTLTISVSPVIIRSLRTSMLGVLESDYVATARSKGVTGWRLYRHHIVRNAIIPAVSIIGVNVGYLIGGTVIIEQVFAIPGVGALMLQSIFARDYPTIQGVVLVIAIFVVLVGVLTDVAYTLLDPRVRLGRRAAR
jgi:peptide/nickel transport system permease protein